MNMITIMIRKYAQGPKKLHQFEQGLTFSSHDINYWFDVHKLQYYPKMCHIPNEYTVAFSFPSIQQWKKRAGGREPTTLSFCSHSHICNKELPQSITCCLYVKEP